jgi:hypothetical protein
MFGDLFPVAPKELARLEQRRVKLGLIEPLAAAASDALLTLSTPDALRVRSRFALLQKPVSPEGDLSDRRLPPRAVRPPATRLMSPRGIALRLYLTSLFVLQKRPVGQQPQNRLPIDDADQTSWVDLIAPPVERHHGLVHSSVRDKKLRQLHEGLRRLSSEDVQLITLAQTTERIGKYEKFALLNEQGRRLDGIDNDPYTVPEMNRLVAHLPASFVTNGWIHLLEDSEIVFLLMLSVLHSLFPSSPTVFVASDIRLLQFGVGRDAYQSHHLLQRFGLVDVEEAEERHIGDSRASGVNDGKMPKLHRFQLLRDGFERPAAEVMREYVTQRIKQAN